MTVDAPTRVGGHYLLQELVTRRSDGVLWRGVDERRGQPVDVLLVPVEVSDVAQWRALAEPVGALSHPGVARVRALGVGDRSESSPTPADARSTGHVVTDVVPGQTVAVRLQRVAALSPTDAMSVLGRVAMALQGVHDAGLLHGDVSAGTVMLRDPDLVTLTGLGPRSRLLATAGGAGSTHDDLRALGALVETCLGGPGASPTTSDVDALVRLLLTGDVDGLTAADVGRAALALAVDPTRSVGLGTPARPSTLPTPTAPSTSSVPRAERGPAGSEPRPTAAATATGPASARDDDASRRRIRNAFIGIAAVVVVLGALVLRAVGGSPPRTPVPQLVGRSYAAAVAAAHHDGLAVRRRDVAATAGHAPGTVQAQSPAVGTRVRTGATVTLSVARPAASPLPAGGLGGG